MIERHYEPPLSPVCLAIFIHSSLIIAKPCSFSLSDIWRIPPSLFRWNSIPFFGFFFLLQSSHSLTWYTLEGERASLFSSPSALPGTDDHLLTRPPSYLQNHNHHHQSTLRPLQSSPISHIKKRKASHIKTSSSNIEYQKDKKVNEKKEKKLKGRWIPKSCWLPALGKQENNSNSSWSERKRRT